MASTPFILVLASIFSLSTLGTVYQLTIRDFGLADVLQVLAALLLIALFLERAMEVFMLTRRELGREEKESELQQASAGSKDEADSAKALREYKHASRKIVLWVNLFVAIAISVAGVRGISPLIEATSLDSVSEWQVMLFQLCDIILTAGVIAGGSDGIHKIARVFGNFMDSTAERARAK